MNFSNPNMFATKKELIKTKDELLDKLATKEDLKQAVSKLATKKELIQTKEDLLNKLATKEELKQEVGKLATKKELKNLEKRFDILSGQVATNTGDIKEIRSELAQIRSEIKNMQSTMSTMQVTIVDMQGRMAKLATKDELYERFDMLLAAIEGLAAKIDDYKTEKSATDHALNRHELQLNDHESRITKLES